MNGHGLSSSLMSVQKVVSDEGNDEIYTYYETCQCQVSASTNKSETVRLLHKQPNRTRRRNKALILPVKSADKNPPKRGEHNKFESMNTKSLEVWTVIAINVFSILEWIWPLIVAGTLVQFKI